jgi:hypothetical protein
MDYSIILLSIGIASLAVLFSEISQVPQAIRSYINSGLIKPIKFKPFTCSLCMSFWISIAYSIYTLNDIGEIIFIVGVAPILSILITKLIRR